MDASAYAAARAGHRAPAVAATIHALLEHLVAADAVKIEPSSAICARPSRIQCSCSTSPRSFSPRPRMPRRASESARVRFIRESRYTVIVARPPQDAAQPGISDPLAPAIVERPPMVAGAHRGRLRISGRCTPRPSRSGRHRGGHPARSGKIPRRISGQPSLAEQIRPRGGALALGSSPPRG
jgi:hypothetical protein